MPSSEGYASGPRARGPSPDQRIRDCPLSVRAVNALTGAGYETVQQCVSLTASDLLRIRNIGRKTAYEIMEFLAPLRTAGRRDEEALTRTSVLPSMMPPERKRYLLAVLPIPLSSIVLSTRARGAVEKLRLRTIGDLVRVDDRTLMRQRNVGTTTVAEIKSLLEELDLNLGLQVPDTVRSGVHAARGPSRNPSLALEEFRESYPKKAGVIDRSRVAHLPQEKVGFYKRFFGLYQRLGTLGRVARETHLSRERVRQILVKGTGLGLFVYEARQYAYISEEDLLSDLRSARSLGEVARRRGVSVLYLKRLLASYGISQEEVIALRTQRAKEKAIREYNAIREQIGRHPTATELQATSSWRALYSRIQHHWGSIGAFRNELRIPPPKRSVEALRPWIEHRKRLGMIRRMQDLEDLRDLLVQVAPLSLREIADTTGIKLRRTYNLIGILMATGEVTREGAGSSVKYGVSMKGQGHD